MGAEDVERAAAFWARALHYDIVEFPDEEDAFTILVPPDGIGTRVAVHRSDVAVQDRPRVHLDLVVDTADEQRRESERLVELGASHVEWAYPADPDFVVLADTEGNRFCIVDASHG
jgi:catechol 2,3-dioxygenase-like lactoylglutathione lyase family enzyme